MKLIENLLKKTSPLPATVILTSESGVGKTLFCLKLVEQARQAGIEPAGLVSPSAYEAGVKVGIDLLEVHSGERKRLANRRPFLPTPGAAPIDSLGWMFDQSVLEWGNQVLSGLQGGPLLIIDELGPLELVHGMGWTAGLSLLDDRKYDLSVVVIRPALLEIADKRWPWARQHQVEPRSIAPLDLKNDLR